MKKIDYKHYYEQLELFEKQKQTADDSIKLLKEEMSERVMSYLTDKHITFPKDNSVPYEQDHHFRRGVPSGIKFRIYFYANFGNSENCKLIAPGYGVIGGDYGNGALYVKIKDIIEYIEQ